jgi:hypothetical protein
MSQKGVLMYKQDPDHDSLSADINLGELPQEVLIYLSTFLTFKAMLALGLTNKAFNFMLVEVWLKRYQMHLPHHVDAARTTMQEQQEQSEPNIMQKLATTWFQIFGSKIQPTPWLQAFKAKFEEEYKGLNPETKKLVLKAIEDGNNNGTVIASTQLEKKELEEWLLKTLNKNRNQRFLDFLWEAGQFEELLGNNTSEFLQWVVLLNQTKHFEILRNALNPQNVKELTQLHNLFYLAVRGGNETIARILIEEGIEVNLRFQISGLAEAAPLHLAAKYGHQNIISLLLEKQADVKQTNNEGITPLFLAAQYGYTEIVRLLIANDADVEKSTSNGTTPLFWPARNGDIDIVKLLLIKNVSLDSETISQAKDNVKPLLELEYFLQGKIISPQSFTLFGFTPGEERDRLLTDKEAAAATALKLVILGADSSILTKHWDTLSQRELHAIYQRCSEVFQLPPHPASSFMGRVNEGLKSFSFKK